MIQTLWLLLLGLGVHEEDKTMRQGQLLLALGLEIGQQKSQGTPKPTSTILSLPAAYYIRLSH